jgi:hypothetical protein
MENLQLTVFDLKDILIHNDSNSGNFSIEVPESRYVKILSDYYNFTGIPVEKDYILEKTRKYNYFVMRFEDTKSTYKIIKNNVKETIGKCANCNCNKKRVLDVDGICFYKKMTEHNYTKKILLNKPFKNSKYENRSN